MNQQAVHVCRRFLHEGLGRGSGHLMPLPNDAGALSRYCYGYFTVIYFMHLLNCLAIENSLCIKSLNKL